MSDQLQLRHWQQIKQAQALEYAGTPEGNAALFESRRYGLAADRIDEMAAQVEAMREALCNLLHRAPAVLDCNDLTHAKKHQHRYDEPCPVTELYDDARDAASEAIALPNTAGTILRQRDARTAASALRYYVKTIPGGSIIDPQWIADDMRRVADELEKQNG